MLTGHKRTPGTTPRCQGNYSPSSRVTASGSATIPSHPVPAGRRSSRPAASRVNLRLPSFVVSAGPETSLQYRRSGDRTSSWGSLPSKLLPCNGSIIVLRRTGGLSAPCRRAGCRSRSSLRGASVPWRWPHDWRRRQSGRCRALRRRRQDRRSALRWPH